jgi:hypothetical protein
VRVGIAKGRLLILAVIVQSDELKARLEKLREMQERKEYAELVKDVAPKEDNTEPFSSYKDQLGFGTNHHIPALVSNSLLQSSQYLIKTNKRFD